jgi:hypothetical protein
LNTIRESRLHPPLHTQDHLWADEGLVDEEQKPPAAPAI